MSDLRGRLETPDAARAFLLAGCATVTLVSTATQARFTFKVDKCEDNERLFFVGTMTGPDNESSFQYLGTIRTGGASPSYSHGRRSRVGEDAPSAKVFAWFARVVLAGGKMPDGLEVWHEDRCGRCGRKLTVPASVSRGFGPECSKRREGGGRRNPDRPTNFVASFV